MSKRIIAVHGATGTQGGSVVKALLNSSSWTVRAITRNAASASAKILIEAGAEVVSANFDDEASLLKAYEVYFSPHFLLLFAPFTICYIGC